MVGEFERRRDAALAMLAGEPGIGVIPPDGAFYLFLDVSGTRGNSRNGAGAAFAQHLLERHDVAVVPGAAFYTPDWVRLSYAAPLDQVVTGVQRTVAAFREMKS
jgi:aspartate aminotransferase